MTRGYIGVQIQPVTPEIAESLGLKSDERRARGAGPAQHAGGVGGHRLAGDVVTGVNGTKIDSPHELSRKIAALGPDATANLTIIRNGAEKTISVKLGKLPEEKEAKADDGRAGQARQDGARQFRLLPCAVGAGAGRRQGRRGGDRPRSRRPRRAEGPASRRRDPRRRGQAGRRARTMWSKALDDAKKEGRRAVLLRVKTGDNTHFLALSSDPS